MILITINGLDQFVVGKYSKENTTNLANLYEVDSSKICFSAPNLMVFHNGVEQTSWNTVVTIKAPLKVKVLEEQISNYIFKTLKTYTINIQIYFEYYEQDRFYESINSAYPRFIELDNKTEDTEDYDCDDHDDCDCDHHHAEEDIYLGNAFEGFEEKLAEAQKKKN